MLKRFLLLLLLPSLGFSQGVKWESSLKVAFEKAAQTQKTLFIEFYSPSCPYCKSIEPFFQDPKVGELYNTNFINYQLSMDTEEGQAFYEDINLDVYGIPFFLFFRPDSTLVHTREVSANLNSVMQPGQMVVADTYAAWNYEKRFDNGERTENFLAQFALFSRIKKDIVTNRKIIDALWKIYPESKKPTQSSWTVVKKIAMDIDNGFVDYWLENLEVAKKYEASNPYAGAEDVFMRVFLNTIESERAKEFDANKWESLSDKFSVVLGDDNVFGLIWEKYTQSLAVEGEQADLKELGDRAYLKFKDDAGSLMYLIYVFNPISKNLTQTEEWLVAAWPLLSASNQKLEYYLQLAILKKKQGDLEAARQAAEDGLKLAEQNQKVKFEEFLSEL